jgi:ribosome-binding factor A
MKRHTDKTPKPGPTGPSQRQLRAGELIRHALVEILRHEDLQDPALVNISVTVTEVRMTPDLRHAVCFVEPLGAGVAPKIDREASSPSRIAVQLGSPEVVVAGLNRVAKFLRGRLGKTIDMKFTPDLKFIHDESFNSAAYMNRLFDNPVVQQDLRRLADVVDDEDN